MRSASIQKPSTPAIKFPAAKTVFTLLRFNWALYSCPVKAAQHSAYSGKHDPGVQGFHNVIVGTKFEADYAIYVIQLIAGCEDDRDIRPRPEVAQDTEPIAWPAPQIENDQTWIGVGEEPIQVGLAWRRLRGDLIVGEIADQSVSRDGIRVHDYDMTNIPSH